MQDDYKEINGRNRDYLLTAWYKHTFSFSEDHSRLIERIDAKRAIYRDDTWFFVNGTVRKFREDGRIGAESFSDIVKILHEVI